MNKLESSPINKTFLRQVSNLPVKKKKPIFVVGVSGGADSMALLYLLHRHAYKPIVVHCNYGLRGKQSDKDQEMVEQICMLWNLECISVRLEYDSTRGGNFQRWARDERYRVFRDLKNEFGAQFILTAHHQDDQLETIFQKILRGSGISALKGMKPVRHDLFRPLLDVTKKQILEFVEDFNIPYRIDGSNEESTYARNFLRNRWFPMLGDLFPGWRTNLLSVADKAEVHHDLIEFALEQMYFEDSSFSRSSFITLKVSLKPVLFKALFDKALPNKTIQKGLLENIHSIESLQTGQSVDITDSHKLIRDRDRFVFLHKKKSEKRSQEIQLLKSELEEGVFFNFMKAVIGFPPNGFSSSELVLDIAKIEFPITIRTWEDGDLFQPFGMDGSQLVSDHLTNRKVSSQRKKEALVMESFDGKIAAVIFPPAKDSLQTGTISEQVRVSETTQKTIKIEITK